jgi:hypothetical protein
MRSNLLRFRRCSEWAVQLAGLRSSALGLREEPGLRIRLEGTGIEPAVHRAAVDPHLASDGCLREALFEMMDE